MRISDLESLSEYTFALPNDPGIIINLLRTKIDDRLNTGAFYLDRNRQYLILNCSTQPKWYFNIKLFQFLRYKLNLKLRLYIRHQLDNLMINNSLLILKLLLKKSPFLPHSRMHNLHMLFNLLLCFTFGNLFNLNNIILTIRFPH